MKNLQFIKLWLIIGWIMTGIVVYLSLFPSPSDMPGFYGSDKLAHFFVYALLMFWFGLCYEPGIRYLLTGAGLILLGIILERIQGMTGYREMSMYDMFANGLGVCFGWILSGTRLSSALIYVERRFGIHEKFM